jgi:hypothetical protein
VWLNGLKKDIGESYTLDDLKNYVKKTLKSGQVTAGSCALLFC